MPITIPKALSDKLAESPEIQSCALQSLIRFEPWIASSGMPFFPGFTDHGPGHLSRVLDTAVWLVARNAWDVLTPEDAGCLILAVLLHDSAMHLTEDGFRALIQHSPDRPPIPEFDQRSWRELWDDFIVEARHWDDARWNAVLGADWRARGSVSLSALAQHKLENLDEITRPFIGEFVRRHHPRMAHEFARGGVPRLDDGERLALATSRSCAHLVDIAGVAARSHGLPLRRVVDYLKRQHDGIRRIYNIHPTFLMALLRVADYLDLHAERAPDDVLRVKTLRSVISRGEWAAHRSITDIRYDSSDDPERIEIVAEPDSAEVYQHVRSWVRGIQAEFDQSWAVLGEVNGDRTPYSLLAMRVRRITTPLDEPGFTDRHRLPFLPEPARFTVVAGEVLPLFVKPLYGNKPEVAIRELLQNAIDAVNERGSSAVAGGGSVLTDDYDNALPAQYGADVVVRLCRRSAAWPLPEDGIPKHWTCWIEVADRGIGMTAETIRNYFLSIGSSFRRSLEWAREFGAGDQVTVLRSGRFGIGVLAAFLLGDEMQVVTRHLRDTKGGLTFRADVSEQPIEIRRISCGIGTTVRVSTDEPTYERLVARPEEWEWFYLQRPAVARIVRDGTAEQALKRSFEIPVPGAATGPWRPIDTSDYGVVLWTHEEHPYRHRIFCNGMLVLEGRANFQGRLLNSLPQWQEPVVSILDLAARLPLTITRDGLHGGLSFVGDLRRDVILDHCAWLLFQAGLAPEDWQPFTPPMWRYNRFFLGEGDGSLEGAAFAIGATGLVPLHGWHLRRAGVSVLTAEINGNHSSNRVIGDAMARGALPSPVLRVNLQPFGGFGEPPDVPALLELLRFPVHLDWKWSAWSCAVSEKYWVGGREADFRTRSHAGFAAARPGWLFYGSDLQSEGVEVEELSRVLAVQAQSLGAVRFHLAQEHVKDDDEFGSVWSELKLPLWLSLDRRTRREQCGSALPVLTPYLERFRETTLDPQTQAIDPWWRSA